MKKYVYTKGVETVTVETDGLGEINNFMVTGLIGKITVVLLKPDCHLRWVTK